MSQLGNRLWRIGEPAMARGSFTRAIALQADLYWAWFAQGFAAGFNQQYDQALASCDRAITLNVSPNNIKYESYRLRVLLSINCKELMKLNGLLIKL